MRLRRGRDRAAASAASMPRPRARSPPAHLSSSTRSSGGPSPYAMFLRSFQKRIMMFDDEPARDRAPETPAREQAPPTAELPETKIEMPTAELPDSESPDTEPPVDETSAEQPPATPDTPELPELPELPDSEPVAVELPMPRAVVRDDDDEEM